MAFGHPAVAELVGQLVFSPKHGKMPLAAIDLEAFSPIPSPLIAYAATGVRCCIHFKCLLTIYLTKLCYGLEEYEYGKRETIGFTEAKYKKYYKDMLLNLKRMEYSESRPDQLEAVQDYILEHGW